MKIVGTLLKKLRNKTNAIIFSVIVLSGLLLLFKNIWSYVFAILLAYLIADLIRIFFLRGERGIVQFTFSGTRSQHKGHAYLVFLIYIIVGTILSGLFSDFIVKQIETLNGIWGVIIPNAIIAILVFLDFNLLFYKRE